MGKIFFKGALLFKLCVILGQRASAAGTGVMTQKWVVVGENFLGVIWSRDFAPITSFEKV